MKVLHISDLHIGKRVNGMSMLDDQRYILRQILDIAEKRQVSVLLIAGDVRRVFDRCGGGGFARAGHSRQP